jgi:putative ABC transport system ATP-binding protein
MQLLENLYERGNTIILVTHEPDIARHARRTVFLRDGLVESDASTAQQPQIERLAVT